MAMQILHVYAGSRFCREGYKQGVQSETQSENIYEEVYLFHDDLGGYRGD